MTVKFTVPGEPKGKGRPRFTKSGHAYTPQSTRDYEEFIKLAYIQKYKDFKFADKEMLDMRIFAFFSIPKSASKKKRADMLSGELRPAKKPDMDNILKIAADALNKIAYHDDAQIVEAMTRKFYSDNPRVEVLIKNIEWKGKIING